MNDLSLREIPWLRHYGVAYHTADYLIVHRRNRIYKTAGKAEPLVEIGCIPITILESILIVFRLGLRFKRLIFYNLFPISHNCYFVNFSNRIGYVENGVYYDIKGIINNCKILNNGAALDDYGNVYFGEYFLNNGRDKPVHIYKFSVTDKKLEIVYVFPVGTIRHIHGIYRDPYTGYFYIATGDKDHECSILYTKDLFNTFCILGAGDETWRTVSILFSQNHIYYGMDAEFIPNKIFCIDRLTCKRKDLGGIPGPVYYSSLLNEIPIFIVAAEMCPSQHNFSASVVYVSNEKIITKYSFAKDLNLIKGIRRLIAMLFLPGNFHLPFHNSKSNTKLYLYGIGLSKADDKSFELI